VGRFATPSHRTASPAHRRWRRQSPLHGSYAASPAPLIERFSGLGGIFGQKDFDRGYFACGGHEIIGEGHGERLSVPL